MASIISSFSAVWGEILEFLSSTWTSLTTLFYSDGNLTIVGTMAIVMSGISLILLAFNLIRSFKNERTFHGFCRAFFFFFFLTASLYLLPIAYCTFVLCYERLIFRFFCIFR